MGLNGISISKKIYTVMLMGVVAVLAITIFSFNSFDNSKDEFHKLATEDIELLSATKDIKYNIAQVQQWLTDISATRGAEGFDDGFTEAEAYSKEVKKNISTLRSYENFMDSGFSNTVSTLSQNFDKFYSVGKQMANIYIKDGPSAGNVFMGTFDTQAEAMQNSIDKLEKITEERVKAKIVAYESDISNAEVILVVFGLSVLAFGVIVSLIIIRGINSSLLSSINMLVDNNSHIKNSASSLNNSANHLLSIATSQTSSTEDMVAILNQSKDNLSKNISHSKEANDTINNSQELAQDGFEKIKSLQDSINNVESSSSKISNIINTINDIAFQTNLLALNAAVEAARAGEHGLGFAVVSEEVKSLASNSAKEAKEISDIISETVSDIQAGTKEAQETRRVFEDIVGGIDKTTTIINDIRDSYLNEESSLDRFISVVREIEDDSQKLSASSEETAASAEELTAQAHNTMEVVESISQMIGK
jgi:methyl-accepting chemotaxis protein